MMDYLKRQSSLEGIRLPHETIYRECADYTIPIRGDGFAGSMQWTLEEARRRQAVLFDSTAARAVQMAASATLGGMAPANAQWFEFQLSDVSKATQIRMEAESELLWRDIHSSNFDAEAYECLIDLFIFGWFVMFITEDPLRGLVFKSWPVSECYISSTRMDGRIDTLHRKRAFTCEQLVAEYGEENVSPDVRELAKYKPDEIREIVICIYPNPKGREGPTPSVEHKPWIARHYECKTKHMLRMDGFSGFPLMVPRWMCIPRSFYGVGPTFFTLPTIRTQNELKKFGVANLDMAVAGMWLAVDDGVVNPRSIKVGPRRVIVAASKDSFTALRPGSDFNVQFAAEDRLDREIMSGYMVDVIERFLASAQSTPMTATQVNAIMTLFRQIMGPVYGRLQAEWLTPLVEYAMTLRLESGQVDPLPADTAGSSLLLRYQNPMAKAQRMEDVSNIEHLLSVVAQIAPVKPDTMDKVDIDAAVSKVAERLGEGVLLREDADVEEMRKARIEQQAAMDQQLKEQELQKAVAGPIAKQAIEGQ